MRRAGWTMAAALAAMAALAGCRPAGPEPLPPVGAALVAQQRAACEKRGGSYRAGGTAGVLYCFTTPRDAGDSCRKAGDCSTACLARSMTCAPIEPLIGCQEVLTDDGARMTQCID